MRVSNLVGVMRGYGLKVVEVAGCYGRGNDFPTQPDGALRHWTAGGAGGKPSLGVVTNGRSDLPGPLAQTLQSREVDPATGLDVVYFVADGKANHAGTGLWNGISGNYKLLGNEIEWSGPSESFGPKRILTSELIARAMLDVCSGTNDDDVAEHREYATPAGRKIDTNLDGNVLRRRMRELRTQPTPTPGDESMPNLVIRGDATTEWWFTDGMTKRYARTSEEVAQHVYAGLARANNGGPFVVPQSMVDYLTTLPGDGIPGHKGVLDIINKLPTANAIADAVVAKLPPSSGGGVTQAQVQAACEAAIDKHLGFLKPGQ